MKDKRWFTRTGALLILLGYVLPSMTVSCTGFPTVGQSITLSQIASQGNMPLLYLIPLGALAVIILAFLPASVGIKPATLFWGQVAGAAAGLASIFINLLTLDTQFRQYGFKITPEYGLFILVAGYILVGTGLTMQWPVPTQTGRPDSWYSEPDQRPPIINQVAPPVRQIHSPEPLSGNWLRVIRGNSPQAIIQVSSNNFSIGRDPGNDLSLQERSVSRQHARLRYAQGAWFIQDLDSTGGTYVNDERVPAKRLESGDEISIGEYTFEFHCQ